MLKIYGGKPYQFDKGEGYFHTMAKYLQRIIFVQTYRGRRGGGGLLSNHGLQLQRIFESCTGVQREGGGVGGTLDGVTLPWSQRFSFVAKRRDKKEKEEAGENLW